VDVDGNLTKASGTFKIDHPLDPANKYLYHSFVESPDMMNIYNGNVTTDAKGSAVVQLPEWFEALNRDFRYQLTVIGQFSQAIVASKVANHQFTIRTEKPNVEVSWQVTGIRQDAWANAHRVKVEVLKPKGERGLYLHPELFGASLEKSIAAARHPIILLRTSSERRKAVASQGSAGWPTLPLPINTEAAPSLRFLQGWAIRHIVPRALRPTLSRAQTSETILRCRLLAFHHLQLLSTACSAGHAPRAVICFLKLWNRCVAVTVSSWLTTS